MNEFSFIAVTSFFYIAQLRDVKGANFIILEYIEKTPRD